MAQQLPGPASKTLGSAHISEKQSSFSVQEPDTRAAKQLPPLHLKGVAQSSLSLQVVLQAPASSQP
jgi:hypothetical protein